MSSRNQRSLLCNMVICSFGNRIACNLNKDSELGILFKNTKNTKNIPRNDQIPHKSIIPILSIKLLIKKPTKPSYLKFILIHVQQTSKTNSEKHQMPTNLAESGRNLQSRSTIPQRPIKRQ